MRRRRRLSRGRRTHQCGRETECTGRAGTSPDRLPHASPFGSSPCAGRRLGSCSTAVLTAHSGDRWKDAFLGRASSWPGLTRRGVTSARDGGGQRGGSRGSVRVGGGPCGEVRDLRGAGRATGPWAADRRTLARVLVQVVALPGQERGRRRPQPLHPRPSRRRGRRHEDLQQGAHRGPDCRRRPYPAPPKSRQTTRHAHTTERRSPPPAPHGNR